MMLSIQELTEQALHLPAAARAQLADQLVESLSADELDHVSRQWVKEALRRDDEMDRGIGTPIPGDDVIAEARRRVGR